MNLFKAYPWLLSLSLFLYSSDLLGQNPLEISCSTSSLTTQHFDVSVTSTFRIEPAMGFSAAQWEFRDCTSGTGCGTFFPIGDLGDPDFGSLPFTGDDSSGDLVITVPSSEEVANYRFDIRVMLSGSDECPKIVELEFIQRRPMQVAFALDQSGSMECPDDETEVIRDGAECLKTREFERRWDKLKSAVSAFANRLSSSSNILLEDDRIGILYFSGSSENIKIGFEESFVEIPVFQSGIGADMTGVEKKNGMPEIDFENDELQRDGTSIGLGLFETLNQENLFDVSTFDAGTSPTYRRILVLFTDGEDNRQAFDIDGDTRIVGRTNSLSPSIDLNSNAGAIGVETFLVAAKSVPIAGAQGILLLNSLASTSENPFTDGQIPWYTEFEGISDFEDFADAIEEELCGDDPDGCLDGINDFINSLDEDHNSAGHLLAPDGILGSDMSYDMSEDLFNRIFAAYSPKFVGIEDQPLDGVNTAEFTLNKGLSKARFSISFETPLANFHIYDLSRDGISFPSDSLNLEVNDYSANIDIDFNAFDTTMSNGVWRIVVRDKIVINRQWDALDTIPNIRFTAIVEDPDVDFDAHVVGPEFRVGDRAGLLVNFNKEGEEYGSAHVFVKFTIPGEDIGHLLSMAKNPDFIEDNEAGGWASQKFADLLQNDPDAARSLVGTPDSIVMTHLGNGKYFASVEDLPVRGVYEAEFVATALDSTKGNIRRTLIETFFVKYSPPNPYLVPPDLIRGIRGDSTAMIEICPAFESNGRTLFVGPGFENVFQVQGDGVVLTEVEDLGNGCYNLFLELTGDQNPTIDVGLLGDPIFEGPLDEIDDYGNTVDSFVLYDAQADTALSLLADGDTLNIYSLPNLELNIEGIAAPVDSNANIGSVMFDIVGCRADGDTVHRNWTESFEPYMLFGDEGDIFGWNLPEPDAGDRYVLRATPFTRARGEGLMGLTNEIEFFFDFKIPDEPDTTFAVTGFTLINPDTDAVIDTLPDGSSFDLLNHPRFAVRANTNPMEVGSVQIKLNSTDGQGTSISQIENVYPYALFGDAEGDYFGGSLPPGTYSITATPFEIYQAGGDAGTSLSIDFEIVNSISNRIDVNIYPNPTVESIRIRSDISKETSGLLTIRYLTDGRIVFRQQVYGSLDEELDMRQLNPGIYVVQFVLDGQVISKKFVKHK